MAGAAPAPSAARARLTWVAQTALTVARRYCAHSTGPWGAASAQQSLGLSPFLHPGVANCIKLNLDTRARAGPVLQIINVSYLLERSARAWQRLTRLEQQRDPLSCAQVVGRRRSVPHGAGVPPLLLHHAQGSRGLFQVTLLHHAQGSRGLFRVTLQRTCGDMT